MIRERDTILIIDFGSQYTQLIARRIRENRIFSLVKPHTLTMKEFNEIKPKGVILSGGPDSVTSLKKIKMSIDIRKLSIPILGICYGMQYIADVYGGKVSKSKKKEFGHSIFMAKKASKIFPKKIINKNINVWMSHSDKVTKIPKGFVITGKSTNSTISSFSLEEKNIYALQFHPEVTNTQFGINIIKTFIMSICKCKKSWTTKNIIQEKISEIKKIVQNEKVLLALSGGVDSTVVAALLKKSIKSNLICMFIDTGLLRKNEKEEVKENIQKKLKLNLKVIDAQSIFMKKLQGVTNPESKRKIIGETFIRIFENESKKFKNVKYLAQGTIYPDVIESSSASKNSDVIKSHHNVGGLPKKFNFLLVEPIRNLFKDEVRSIGKELSIPDKLLNRHPFPGPGLAVRIIGDISKDKISILQDVDNIFIEELISSGFYDKISQALAVFLPIKSVGVMGDQRQYNYVVALRSVKTSDFMTASVSTLPFELLNKISTRIINEVPKVSRVVYDITSKPPGTIEWE